MVPLVFSRGVYLRGGAHTVLFVERFCVRRSSRSEFFARDFAWQFLPSRFLHDLSGGALLQSVFLRGALPGFSHAAGFCTAFPRRAAPCTAAFAQRFVW